MKKGLVSSDAIKLPSGKTIVNYKDFTKPINIKDLNQEEKDWLLEDVEYIFND